MTITLSDGHEQLVQKLLASGQYPSPSDVIAAALDLLDATPEAHAKLRAMIAVGEAAIARGEVGPLNAVETLARVRARRGAQ